MRTEWQRKAVVLDLDAASVALLLRPVAGDARVLSVRPVTGGLVNTNLEVALSGPPGRVLLRLFQRTTPQARIEVAIDRLIAGRVPTARFLHFAETNAVTGGPYAVQRWIDGERLDHVATGADDRTLAALGAATGEVLARIHSFRFERAGFFTEDLRVPEPIDFGRDGLLDLMQCCLRQGPGGERLGAELTERLFAFVSREGNRLDAWPAHARLTHADFNPSNILVRREHGTWRIAAVLDWEFVLSATPALDFANLLRPPLGEQSAFADGIAHGYRQAGGVLAADWRRIARIVDLFAWADLLGQRPYDPALAADARRIIAATIGGAAGPAAA